jgi:hypothetical protein
MTEDRPADRSDDSGSQEAGVAGAGGERGDGRPAGVPAGSGDDLEGRPATVREASPERVPAADEVPTVAPEERGETPETEHAPGADL